MKKRFISILSLQVILGLYILQIYATSQSNTGFTYQNNLKQKEKEQQRGTIVYQNDFQWEQTSNHDNLNPSDSKQNPQETSPSDSTTMALSLIAAVMSVAGAAVMRSKRREELAEEAVREGGVWIGLEGRDRIRDLLLQTVGQGYDIDEEGFVIKRQDAVFPTASHTFQRILDELLYSQKRTVVNVTSALEQYEEFQRLQIQGSVSLGSNETEQLVVLNEQDTDKDLRFVFAHEMIHAWRGIQGLEAENEEQEVVAIENQVRQEWGESLRQVPVGEDGNNLIDYYIGYAPAPGEEKLRTLVEQSKGTIVWNDPNATVTINGYSKVYNKNDYNQNAKDNYSLYVNAEQFKYTFGIDGRMYLRDLGGKWGVASTIAWDAMTGIASMKINGKTLYFKNGVNGSFIDPSTNRMVVDMNSLAQLQRDVQKPLPISSPYSKASTNNSITIGWEPTKDNTNVAFYKVWRWDENIGQWKQVSTTVSPEYKDESLESNKYYSYAITAMDYAGNESEIKNINLLKTNAESSLNALETVSFKDSTPTKIDKKAPFAPSNFQAEFNMTNEITLSWSEPYDNVGVHGYTIYKNGERLTTVTKDRKPLIDTFVDKNIKPDQDYTFEIEAFDAQGNTSKCSVISNIHSFVGVRGYLENTLRISPNQIRGDGKSLQVFGANWDTKSLRFENNTWYAPSGKYITDQISKQFPISVASVLQNEYRIGADRMGYDANLQKQFVLVDGVKRCLDIPNSIELNGILRSDSVETVKKAFEQSLGKLFSINLADYLNNQNNVKTTPDMRFLRVDNGYAIQVTKTTKTKRKTYTNTETYPLRIEDVIAKHGSIFANDQHTIEDAVKQVFPVSVGEVLRNQMRIPNEQIEYDGAKHTIYLSIEGERYALAIDTMVNIGGSNYTDNEQKIKDAVLHVAGKYFDKNGVYKDPIPPSAPSQLTIASGSITGKGVTLHWLPATDNVAVDRYEIIDQAGARVGQTEGNKTSLVLNNLEPGKTYQLSVVAHDQFNASTKSNVVEFNTQSSVREYLQSIAEVGEVGFMNGKVTAFGKSLKIANMTTDANRTYAMQEDIRKALQEAFPTKISSYVTDNIKPLQGSNVTFFYRNGKVYVRENDAEREIYISSKVKQGNEYYVSDPIEVNAVMQSIFDENIKTFLTNVVLIPKDAFIGIKGNAIYVTINGVTKTLEIANAIHLNGVAYTNDGKHIVDALKKAFPQNVDVNGKWITTDTSAPSAPRNLRLQDRTSDSITFQWEASKDNVGVKEYVVYRDGKEIATTKNTFYKDSSLEEGTNHKYEIVAKDVSGNRSVISQSAIMATTYSKKTYLVEEAKTSGAVSWKDTNTVTVLKNGTLSFDNVTVPISGTYAVNIYYKTTGNRQLSISTNGGKLQTVGTQGSISYMTVNVPLLAGANKLDLSNLKGGEIDIDSIEIEAEPNDGTAHALPVTELHVNAVTDEAVSLRWKKPHDDNIIGYEVFDGKRKLAEFSADAEFGIVENLDDRTKYNLRVVPKIGSEWNSKVEKSTFVSIETLRTSNAALDIARKEMFYKVEPQNAMILKAKEQWETSTDKTTAAEMAKKARLQGGTVADSVVEFLQVVEGQNSIIRQAYEIFNNPASTQLQKDTASAMANLARANGGTIPNGNDFQIIVNNYKILRDQKYANNEKMKQFINTFLDLFNIGINPMDFPNAADPRKLYKDIVGNTAARTNLMKLVQMYPSLFQYNLAINDTFDEYLNQCLLNFAERFELQGKYTKLEELEGYLFRAVNGKLPLPGTGNRNCRSNLMKLVSKYPKKFNFNLAIDNTFDEYVNKCLLEFVKQYDLAGKYTSLEELQYYLKQAVDGKILPKVENSAVGNLPTIAGEVNLGYLSGIGESNNNPGLISTGNGDIGGKSYGAFQFASNFKIPTNFLKWLKDNNIDMYNKLNSAYETDDYVLGKKFDATWKQIASENENDFLKMQYLYTKYSYYDISSNAIKNATGFDFDSRGFALRNVLWSRAVQHGQRGVLNVVKRALSTLEYTSASDEEIIKAIYAESGSVMDKGTISMTTKFAKQHGIYGKTMKYFDGNSADVQAGVWNRLNIEEPKQAIALLKNYN